MIASRCRCGCDRIAYCRGLCKPCYQAAWRAVRAALVTWQELEATGKVRVATPTRPARGGNGR